MFDIRKTLYEYSSLIEKQRTILHNERNKVSLNDNVLLEYGTHGYKRNIGYKDVYLCKKLKEVILFQHDKYWSMHLDFLSEIKEGIHLLRIGGQNPLREFQKKADRNFQEICAEMDMGIQHKINCVLKNQDMELANLGIKKPSSTWTYITNDYPFGNKLELMLLDNSNIGFQLDIFSLSILFIRKLFKRKHNN
ncbi:MAG: hypothetical protein GXO81_10205 [Chlorobi bacterium]|nr:hypothetical protein [Chlorobiota bacterium]